MRVAVSSSGYADAAGALLDANQLGATWFGGLVDRLSVGGFAGDDSFAGAWAATYDESAASVMECFAELVGALGNLSLLTEVSGLNHRRADEASIIVRPGLYVGGSSSHALGDRSVTVAAPVLPSALGGDDGNAPWWWDKAFDAVEGLVWPDADCSRLRSVGEEWRVAAGRLEQLVSQVDVASHLLSEQRSPEIADALATLADVRAAVEQLVMSMRELGDGCRDHADEVEKHRDMIIEIGKDFLVEAGITQVVTWGLTPFTGGGSQAAGQSVQAARIAMYAAKFKKVIASLPEPTRVQRARVDAAVRDVSDHLGQGLTRPWQGSIRAAATRRLPELNDRLDRALVDTDLGVAKLPWWTGPVRATQWVLIAAAFVGALWLGALAIVGDLQLPDVPTYDVGSVPLPTLLLGGGVLLGILLALVCRGLVALTARSKARSANRKLRAGIREVAQQLVVEPVETELRAYETVRTGLATVLK